MAVFVLDRSGRPLMPCTEKRARLLLERGRARVHKVLPFTIRIADIEAENCEFQALRVKLDPGSKTTGIALVRETQGKGVAVINLFELVHRGKQISEALTARRGHRRIRRSKAMGRGSYQRTRLDRFGCVRGYLTRSKSIHGFQTGDMVRAAVSKGKKTGSYTGRVAVRATGSFNIQTGTGLVQGVSHRYCTVVQRGDGYGYSLVAKTDVTGTPPQQGTHRVPRS